MAEFLQWLNNNSVATNVLIAAFGIGVVSITLMYLIALIQGRSVSFWPPQIEKKQKDEKELPNANNEHPSERINNKISIRTQGTVIQTTGNSSPATSIGRDFIGGDKLEINNFYNESIQRPGSAPPLPQLIIGRDGDLSKVKNHLINTNSVQVLTAIRGWPGVGKTTLAAALAHDPIIVNTFRDGVLWVSLGPTPSLISELATWGRALGTKDILQAKSLQEASAQLTSLLRDKQMLLIVDDVWEPEHFLPFKVGGRKCSTLVTTRINSVAQAVAPKPADIYKLAVLSDEKSIELLQTLAPNVVSEYPHEALDLVRQLEGLPLALQVAGHMLNTEFGYGFSIANLLDDLKDGAKLLDSQVPVELSDLANQTTSTVATLLKKSTDRLDEQTRNYFAMLGPFAPKPSTFHLGTLQLVWQVEDPKPIVRILVDRGLLEYVAGRYQMHSLLTLLAKSPLTS